MAIFAEIAEELHRNGFEVEPFGLRTLAIKSAPAGIAPREVELAERVHWSSSRASSRR